MRKRNSILTMVLLALPLSAALGQESSNRGRLRLRRLESIRKLQRSL
jgi:hypothetical protein